MSEDETCRHIPPHYVSMMVFWVIMLRGIAGRYQHFRAKDEGSMFLKMFVSTCKSICMELQP
jgi:hypothetical protein